MDIFHSSTSQALLVFDACTLNPFKDFKTTKTRLKKKLQRQLRDQPRIAKLLIDLERGNGFSITKFIPIAMQTWAHANDEQVLNKLEELASENPDHIVIFITRDMGFCEDAGWRPEQSRVYICLLPQKYLSKTIDQFSRLEMMYIIAIDITHLFTRGQVTYSRLFIPTLTPN